MSTAAATVSKGSASFTSAASATIVAAGSTTPSQWTVKTRYQAKNVNPDLRVVLRIGDESYTIAPGVTTSTHQGTGRQVEYVCTFLAGVDLELDWDITSS